jgi:CRP/FNR family cyclic AMP-dependent transcriptional regulator
MRTIDQLLEEHPFFAGLGPDLITLATGCAQIVHFDAGAKLFRTGDAADHFYVIRSGRVALELVAPGRDPLVVDTVDAGEVLGWSWLVPPYTWFCDGRAAAPTSVVALDGACLRSKCDADPALGYRLLQRVAHVMYERLNSSRVRLLDLYGVPSAAHH